MADEDQLSQHLWSLNEALCETPSADIEQLLTERRQLLEQFANQTPSPGDQARFREAIESGRKLRTRLVVEIAQIRAEIQELTQLRSGLGQFLPSPKQTTLVDVRL